MAKIRFVKVLVYDMRRGNRYVRAKTFYPPSAIFDFDFVCSLLKLFSFVDKKAEIKEVKHES